MPDPRGHSGMCAPAWTVLPNRQDDSWRLPKENGVYPTSGVALYLKSPSGPDTCSFSRVAGSNVVTEGIQHRPFLHDKR